MTPLVEDANPAECTPDEWRKKHAVKNFCQGIGRAIGHPVGYQETAPEKGRTMTCLEDCDVCLRACVDCDYYRVHNYEYASSDHWCSFFVTCKPEFSAIKGWRLNRKKRSAKEVNPDGHCPHWVRAKWLRRWWSRTRA